VWTKFNEENLWFYVENGRELSFAWKSFHGELGVTIGHCWKLEENEVVSGEICPFMVIIILSTPLTNYKLYYMFKCVN